MINASEYFWRGKRVRDMSRAELETAFLQLATMHQANLSPDMIRARALGEVEMIKRGEKRWA